MSRSFERALEMAHALDAVFGARSAQPNEIGAWLTAYASETLRHHWKLRTKLLEGAGRTPLSFEEITAVIPQAEDRERPLVVPPAPSPTLATPGIPTARAQAEIVTDGGRITTPSRARMILETLGLVALGMMITIVVVLIVLAVSHRN